jgi:hypothetical protein
MITITVAEHVQWVVGSFLSLFLHDRVLGRVTSHHRSEPSDYFLQAASNLA